MNNREGCDTFDACDHRVAGGKIVKDFLKTIKVHDVVAWATTGIVVALAISTTRKIIPLWFMLIPFLASLAKPK